MPFTATQVNTFGARPQRAFLMEATRAGLPVTVLLNREGEEIARLMGGADWNTENARAILDYVAALPG